MKTRCGFCLGLISIAAWAHPGGGIVALSGRFVIYADPTENTIWQQDQGNEPKPLITRFHGHWLTRGLDGQLYVEAFQETGGAWSSAAFQLDPDRAKLTEIAHHRDLNALVFAVDRDGSLVFQRGSWLVARRTGQELPFRPHAEQPTLDQVTAYAWGSAGQLYIADRNRVYGIAPTGVVSLLAEIAAKVPEPRIWNATETPSIFSLAVDRAGSVLAAVPDLGIVYRIGSSGTLIEIARSEAGWRATGIATFDEVVFLLESDSRASTSPRVRILRSSGVMEPLTMPESSR